MEIERDKFLTEAIGECWHEYKTQSIVFSPVKCLKCGKDTCTPSLANNKYFDSWGGFGKLWKWSEKQDWWPNFYDKYFISIRYSEFNDHEYRDFKMQNYIDPDKFANTVYEYLKGRK